MNPLWSSFHATPIIDLPVNRFLYKFEKKMETIIIKPRDRGELNFFLELIQRLGVNAKTYEEMKDEELLQVMEENSKTPRIGKEQIMGTIQMMLEE
jgi:hypothetical protein